jgi:hypothetical protein
MTVLLDADGPFKGCDRDHTERPLGQLPHDPPPPGMFEPDQPVNDLVVPGAGASAPPAVRAGGRPPGHTLLRSR